MRDIDVIITGRIEGRKNQVSVMKALSGSGVKMRLVGAMNQRHQNYLAEFKKLLAQNPSYEYLGPRPHCETLTLMARSKVYVSASWLEVMSLSDLEAFAAGCRVIASTHGSTSEVLGERVRYVNPGSGAEIRTAILEELASNATEDTSGRAGIIERYQWDNLGKTLIEIYKREIRRKT
jgi:glycosyltransferase involved in cell wall biosynthesis